MATALPSVVVDRHRLSDRFRPLAHVVWARQADATVLLDAERGLYYTLNEVAGRAWDLLVSGEPLIEVLRCLGNEYQVPLERLQTDVDALLELLLAKALLERVAP